MGDDEAATVRILTAYRDLMATLVRRHRGRVVDFTGDNLLGEFASVVDAVRCAVETQEELKVRNADLPDHRKMEFRIGVNLGDVIVDGERIYGDGVNVAARVQGLADGGGICVSASVYDQVKNKLAFSYESLGEHAVKNIAEPVRVYRVLMQPGAAAPPADTAKKRWPRVRWKTTVAVLAGLVLVVGAGVAVWNVYFRPPAPPGLELPDRPSIAVLPFANLSGDPQQEHFADGMTEELITILSKVSGPYPHAALAAVYVLLDREPEARAAMAHALKLDPTISLERVARGSPYKDPKDLERTLEVYRRAGLK
jgi:adenylate cyclase